MTDKAKAPAAVTREPWTAEQINNWYAENFGGFSPGTEPHAVAHVAFVRLKNLLGLQPEASVNTETTSTSKE